MQNTASFKCFSKTLTRCGAIYGRRNVDNTKCGVVNPPLCLQHAAVQGALSRFWRQSVLSDALNSSHIHTHTHFQCLYLGAFNYQHYYFFAYGRSWTITMSDDEPKVPDELFKDVKFYMVGDIDQKVSCLLKLQHNSLARSSSQEVYGQEEREGAASWTWGLTLLK